MYDYSRTLQSRWKEANVELGSGLGKTWIAFKKFFLFEVTSTIKKTQQISSKVCFLKANICRIKVNSRKSKMDGQHIWKLR